MKKEFRRLLVLVIAIISLFFSNGVFAAVEEKPFQKQDLLREAGTEKEVYDLLIALKDNYPEGMPWDNCYTLAYNLSSEVFGQIKARTVGKKNFTYDIIKIGDIINVVNSSGTSNHYVVVLELCPEGITVVEGNYGGTVHWGRFISREYIEENFLQLITRYPDTSYHHAAKEKNKKLYDSDGKVVDSYQLKKKTLKYKGIKEKKVAQAGFDVDGDLIFLTTNGRVKLIDHITLEVRGTNYTDIDKLLPKKTTGLIISVKYGKMTEKIKK